MKHDAPYVAHILDAIEAVQEYCAIPKQEFLNDRKTKDAVLRNFQVIGEAAKKLSDTFRQQTTDVDWPGIISLRNRVVHECFSVDYEIVWHIATEEMAPLHAALHTHSKEKRP